MSKEASLAIPLVRQFSKQIAGHAMEKGSSKPGMMKHADGSLLKPILPPPRGQRELNFYMEAFDQNGDELFAILKPLLPEFRGVFSIEEKEKEYLKLEDLTENFKHPCILDIKMGAKTYDPDASEQKIRREQQKYRHTKAFGFCIPGMRVFHLPTQQYICKGKEYGKHLNELTIKDAFRLYLNSGSGSSAAVIRSFLARLQKVRHWFLTQSKYAFYASSLLLIYDADVLHEVRRNADSNNLQVGSGETIQNPEVAESSVEGKGTLRPDGISSSAGDSSILQLTDVRMIDFAHVFESTETDDNYLQGLNCLIRLLEELLAEEGGK